MIFVKILKYLVHTCSEAVLGRERKPKKIFNEKIFFSQFVAQLYHATVKI